MCVSHTAPAVPSGMASFSNNLASLLNAPSGHSFPILDPHLNEMIHAEALWHENGSKALLLTFALWVGTPKDTMLAQKPTLRQRVGCREFTWEVNPGSKKKAVCRERTEGRTN